MAVRAKRTDLELLAGIDLFDGVTKKNLAKILDVGKRVTKRAGQTIVTEGENGVAFHLILEGSATVTKKGRKVATLARGDHFGEVALIDPGPRSATVVAATDVTTLSISSWVFKRFLLDNPIVGWKLLVVLCRRFRDLSVDPLA